MFNRFGILSIISSIVGLLGVCAAKEKQPNVVVIVADDMGWGDLSCHGHPWVQTPNLDQLAKQGVNFQQGMVVNPVCSPSRAAMLTGVYPARLSIHEHFAKPSENRKRMMPDWLDPKAPNWIRLFHDAGYQTAHYGKWHLTNASVKNAPLPTAYGYDAYAVFNGAVGWPIADFRQTADEAARFIKSAGNKPFAMNVWIHESHTPHKPSDAAMEKWKHLDEQKQVYAAVMTDADIAVGKVMQALKDANKDQNTIVVFTSDNGPEETGPPKNRLSEDPDANINGFDYYFSIGSAAHLYGKKRSLHEGGVRVPFLVSWPSQIKKPLLNQHSVVSAVDLLPTLCAAAHIKLPAGFDSDGENMLAAFKGEEIKRKKPLFFEWRPGSGNGANWPVLVVRDGDWKYLMNDKMKREELYNMCSDAGERTNLAQSYPEIVTRLKEMVLNWKATLPTKVDADCQDPL